MKIEIDLHTHTLASSHAYSTLYENLQEAKAKGLKGIAVTNHGPDMEDSPHFWHFNCIGAIPKSAYGITILKGIEANIINKNGEIDARPPFVKKLDFVIASYHPPVYASGTVKELEEAYLNALENPYVKIIGHLDRGPFEINYERVINKAKEKKIAVELNRHSLSLSEQYRGRVIKIAEICNRLKVPVTINSDAHFCSSVGDVGIVFDLLEETNFDETLILNSDINKTLEFLDVKE
ncbi:MAG: phosphatase [Clostridia bacterium]|nr:phosphatase [Clostridia bacterium]